MEQGIFTSNAMDGGEGWTIYITCHIGESEGDEKEAKDLRSVECEDGAGVTSYRN